jgi:hypothetical protein
MWYPFPHVAEHACPLLVALYQFFLEIRVTALRSSERVEKPPHTYTRLRYAHQKRQNEKDQTFLVLSVRWWRPNRKEKLLIVSRTKRGRIRLTTLDILCGDA